MAFYSYEEKKFMKSAEFFQLWLWDKQAYMKYLQIKHKDEYEEYILNKKKKDIENKYNYLGENI